MPTKLKTGLDHFPEEKRKDLRRIARLVVDEFGDEVEMVVLYGSYARGDWLEEIAPDGHHFQYQSDYDVMVVTRDQVFKHTQRWDKVKQAFKEPDAPPARGFEPLQQVKQAFQTLDKPSLQLERCTIGFLNHMIEQGYYFYVDVAKEGIALYDSERSTLSEPKILTPAEALDKALAHYDTWYKSATGFYKCYRFSLAEGELNIAAFLLHQTTERFLTAYLLVHTDYKPRTHDLDRLMPLAAAHDVEALKVFPKGTQQEQDRFDLLRRAYVDARYNPDYSITREELDYLAGRIEFLQAFVQRTCQEKIENLKSRLGEAPSIETQGGGEQKSV